MVKDTDLTEEQQKAIEEAAKRALAPSTDAQSPIPQPAAQPPTQASPLTPNEQYWQTRNTGLADQLTKDQSIPAAIGTGLNLAGSTLAAGAIAAADSIGKGGGEFWSALTRNPAQPTAPLASPATSPKQPSPAAPLSALETQGGVLAPSFLGAMQGGNLGRQGAPLSQQPSIAAPKPWVVPQSPVGGFVGGLNSQGKEAINSWDYPGAKAGYNPATATYRIDNTLPPGVQTAVDQRAAAIQASGKQVMGSADSDALIQSQLMAKNQPQNLAYDLAMQNRARVDQGQSPLESPFDKMTVGADGKTALEQAKLYQTAQLAQQRDAEEMRANIAKASPDNKVLQAAYADKMPAREMGIMNALETEEAQKTFYQDFQKAREQAPKPQAATSARTAPKEDDMPVPSWRDDPQGNANQKRKKKKNQTLYAGLGSTVYPWV